MSSDLDGVRLETILRLQLERMNSRPGSDVERIIEYAIDLCLNTGRAADNAHYLHRNVLRDAKKQFYRDGGRERQANARFLVAQGYARDYTEPLGYRVFTSAEANYLGEDSPLCDAAREVSVNLGLWGPRFLALLQDGHSVAAAAASVGVSRATGYRAQRKLAVALAPLDSRRLA